MTVADPFDQARVRYVSERPRFEAAEAVMREQLLTIQRIAGVRADTDVRAKTVSSFIKKLHLNRAKYTDPWADITDKLGGRVIADTLAELAELRAVFADPTKCPVEVLRIEDKTEEAHEYLLYYPGVHVQVVVPNAVTSDQQPIECEVQLRTKAQDLWSVPSHKLIYKPIIEPSKRTRRRVLRLSVLVEIFDEEVEQAMKEVASLPGYEEMRLLRTAESLYLTFVAEPGDDNVSLEVLSGLKAAIPLDADYAEALASFVEDHKAKLEHLYDQYGAYSPWANEWAYWLASQPESVIILERIERAPMLLAGVVSGTELEPGVSQLFEIWGAAFPA